jgi:hypothetical protein
MSASPAQPTALQADLSLVLPHVNPVAIEPVSCLIDGRSASVERGLARAGELMSVSAAPAITGLHRLSIEACRPAVALAEELRGRLLAPRAATDPLNVTMTATLGHARKAQRVLWVGVTPQDVPAQLLHLLRGARHDSVADSLEAVQALRRDPAPLAHDKRVAVLLGKGVDERVASQWHRLAAQVQRQVRVAVLSLPWPGEPDNARGADEVVTWQTGLSLSAGGVDFSDGSPRPCLALDTLLSLRAIDLLITADRSTFSPRITLGEADPGAAVSFITPGLVMGMACQVARFDGVILRLCDDPDGAPRDPAVELLHQFGNRGNRGDRGNRGIRGRGGRA